MAIDKAATLGKNPSYASLPVVAPIGMFLSAVRCRTWSSVLNPRVPVEVVYNNPPRAAVVTSIDIDMDDDNHNNYSKPFSAPVLTVNLATLLILRS